MESLYIRLCAVQRSHGRRRECDMRVMLRSVRSGYAGYDVQDGLAMREVLTAARLLSCLRRGVLSEASAAERVRRGSEFFFEFSF